MLAIIAAAAIDGFKAALRRALLRVQLVLAAAIIALICFSAAGVRSSVLVPPFSPLLQENKMGTVTTIKIENRSLFMYDIKTQM